MAIRCTLTGIGDLPMQFSYRPPMPVIRMSRFKTADGSFTIYAMNPPEGDTIIQWKIEAAERAEWHAIRSLFTNPNNMITPLTFTGYWGEAFTVLALKMPPSVVRAAIFDLEGEFEVTGVASWGTAS